MPNKFKTYRSEENATRKRKNKKLGRKQAKLNKSVLEAERKEFNASVLDSILNAFTYNR